MLIFKRIRSILLLTLVLFSTMPLSCFISIKQQPKETFSQKHPRITGMLTGVGLGTIFALSKYYFFDVFMNTSTLRKHQAFWKIFRDTALVMCAATFTQLIGDNKKGTLPVPKNGEKSSYQYKYVLHMCTAATTTVLLHLLYSGHIGFPQKFSGTGRRLGTN